jgi:hypothetical protein
MARKLTQYDQKRRALRNTMWADSDQVIYNREAETGFTTVPRTLSLVCTLLKVLGEKNDPSRVYLELWCRQRDDGFVEILDTEELASSAGFYRGPKRQARSLREALDRLAQLGFIRISAKGTRKYGYVLVLHPHDVVQRMKDEEPDRIPGWWWGLFSDRTQDIKAVLRLKPAPRKETFEDFPEGLDEDEDTPS